MVDAAERHKVKIVEVRRGEILKLKGIELHFLNPPQNPYDEDNDNSVAFVAYIQGARKTYSALFVGDMSDKVEREIAFPADILLAGHFHGSPHSTTEAMLRATNPERAVFSWA
ncbi:MAG: hypothetical protein R2865_02880 [Deinococcales bacterium]